MARASFSYFDRTVSLAPGSSDTKWVEAQLAEFAKEQLRDAQIRGEANNTYVRTVSGIEGAPESSVIAPGDIVYTFAWLSDAARVAKELLMLHSPVRTGLYRRSFIFVADGIEVPLSEINHQRVVEVVNTQPYSRKIQLGSYGYEDYRGLFDLVARRIRSQFKNVVSTRVSFVSLSNGAKLKRGKGRRRERMAGAEITYPALRLTNNTTGFH